MRIRRLKLQYELTGIGLTIGMLLLVLLVFLRKQPARLRLQAFSLGLPTWQLPELDWLGQGGVLLWRIYSLLLSARRTSTVYLWLGTRGCFKISLPREIVPTRVMLDCALPRLC